MKATKPGQAVSVVMLGASGAVGGQVVSTLLKSPGVSRLTLLGRKPVPGITGPALEQHTVDALSAASYQHLLAGHGCAICTLGVGQPSKMSRQEFLKIDRDAVIDFATACKTAGVRHFELLSAVGANAKSPSFYLRTKGELQEALVAMKFERLSLFQPSMILTPTNRYGIQQALTLALWPMLSHALIGPTRKYRGIRMEALGEAMATNLFTKGTGVEYLQWDEFGALATAR